MGGGHGWRGRPPGLVGVVAALPVGLCPIQVPTCTGKHLLWHIDPRRLGTVDRHQLPAEDTRIARLAWNIPPAALAALRGAQEIDRQSRRQTQLLVPAQPQGIAQDDGRLAVNIHPRAALAVAAEVSVELLVVQQPLQSPLDVLAVDAQRVRLSRTEECHQC